MASPASQFVWYELMTTEPSAAESFYKNVFGWHMQDAGMPGGAYTLLSAGTTMIGGLMGLSPEMCAAGARPGWIGYIGVPDVDASAARAVRLGGQQHRAPADIPGVGRFAVMADPHGAAFVLFKGNGPDPAPVVAGTPGHVGWNELQAGSLDAAFAFYAEMFGWARSEAIDMGPMGTYQLFNAGGDAIGGMMTKLAEVPVPFWLYYVNVASVEAALERVKAGGGQVVNGPMEVPGGSWIANCIDPQGALFAFVGPKA
jgi:predicted enzyme related to lactoylglutathione lyase